MAQYKGIDISSAQGNVNFKKAKSQVDFVIIRCGYGNNEVKQDDKKFDSYVKSCIDEGIPFGVYLYSYALSVEDAKSEFEHTRRLMNGIYKGKKIRDYCTLGVYLDMEDADGYKVRNLGGSVYNYKDLWQTIVNTWCNLMVSDGYSKDEIGVYANLDWFRNCLDYNKCASLGRIWLAQWGNNKSKDCDMWQHTSSGTVNGISGRVDMDLAFFEFNKKDEQVEKVEIQFYPKVNYRGFSIVQVCNLLGIDSSFAFRSKIAEANGIENYRGTALQNISLVKLAKSGIMKKVI